MRLPIKVLFVCVENSCRSQLAEAFARHHGRGLLAPASAGSRPSGRVNPKAAAALRARGIDASGQRSKGLADVAATGWDYVVTMGCGDACPYVPAKGRLDWDVPDPKDLPAEEFSRVCDLIEEKVRRLVADHRA